MKIFWIIVIISLLGGGFWLYSSMNTPGIAPVDTTISTPTPTSAQPTQAQSNNKTVEVDITSSGFSPNNLTINLGDTVKFVNKDSTQHQPASAPHPAHTCFPGFDALKGLKTGDSYSFTFTITKTCGFHDHLNPSLYGSITVQ